MFDKMFMFKMFKCFKLLLFLGTQKAKFRKQKIIKAKLEKPKKIIPHCWLGAHYGTPTSIKFYQ